MDYSAASTLNSAFIAAPNRCSTDQDGETKSFPNFFHAADPFRLASINMVSQDALKQHVATAVRKADLTTVSAKQIRQTVETQLNLSQGTLSNDKWKGLVKTVIEETMASIERGDPPSQQDVEQSDSDEQVARIFLS
jgi:hypothetical protein